MVRAADALYLAPLGASRGTSRGLAPPAPYVFYELFEALLEAAKGARWPEVRI